MKKNYAKKAGIGKHKKPARKTGIVKKLRKLFNPNLINYTDRSVGRKKGKK